MLRQQLDALETTQREELARLERDYAAEVRAWKRQLAHEGARRRKAERRHETAATSWLAALDAQHAQTTSALRTVADVEAARVAAELERLDLLDRDRLHRAEVEAADRELRVVRRRQDELRRRALVAEERVGALAGAIVDAEAARDLAREEAQCALAAKEALAVEVHRLERLVFGAKSLSRDHGTAFHDRHRRVEAAWAAERARAAVKTLKQRLRGRQCRTTGKDKEMRMRRGKEEMVKEKDEGKGKGAKRR